MYYRAIYLLIIIICLNSTCYGRFHSRFHHISINENEISSRHLLSFNLINSIKSYQLVSTNIQLHKYFTIENKTHLYAVQSLDREYLCAEQFCSCLTQCSLQLKILSQPEHQIIFVNITINDLNDNLHYFRSNEIQIHIPENTNIQHRQCYRIPNVEDKDLPETNQFIYQLIGNGSEKFEIDQTIGNDLCLRIKNHPLDREERHQYDHLWIIVTDKQQQQDKMKINIQVLDVNDNSPKFLTNLTKVSVNETFTGELICTQAYDPDEGNNGRIIYSFDHFDDKLTQFLYLNNETGCLFILKSLLLTSIDLIPLLQLNNHLLLTIRAQDCGSRMSSTLPAYHPLEIIIDDINDHKPTIQVRQIISSIDIIKNNSQINIIENTIGILAMITVDDIDQGIYGQVQLNLIVQTSNKKHRQALQLKSTSMKHYKIELISPLDYELESTIILFLDAIDGGGEHSRFIINIIVDDMNDMPPHFEHDHYHFITNIQSSSPSSSSTLFDSTIVGQVHATDPDVSTTNSLIYSLNSNLFRINSETGQISLIEPLPINMTDQVIIFNVTVSDGEHESQTHVTISIEGLNHRPEFEKDQYFFQIDENVPIRTVVGQIIGKDVDLPGTRRGELTYTLRSITAYSEFFFHTSHTGQVLVTRIPDAEQQQIHQFIVTVRDHGTPPLSSDAKLTIKVNDINEYCPHLVNFSSEPYIFVSRQRFKKTPAEKFSYRLFAFDKDISDQSNITFNLLPSTYSSAFKLTTNGLLTIDDLPLKLPSIIELDYSLTDTFFPEPCIKQDKLIILIGDTSIDRDYLINEYEKQLETSQHQRLITQKLANNKRKKQETIILFLTFSLSTSVIFLGILCLLCLFCCRKQKRRNRQRSITTKSSSLINPSLLEDSKQQSPHSFITDCNGKSSLLPPLR
ncbi:unnamed protein product [Rotaria socialis]|uniref:Cadherin domain-containing protein n=1 Tax=Rotaria socialis TaxID=392032 RepID=A0A817Z2F0_9BILA|nr:unnamed protein product [Rotaria socialis]CAF3463200.1 unnamed protein product [Rotaria socialis]CAF3697151.1 unnamed protein product [Rotaria socialis]CAF4141922.1 unnamed protein product [Rotaria socialis]CAF4162876.1 unnamed protein product [Rotaria socialis]